MGIGFPLMHNVHLGEDFVVNEINYCYNYYQNGVKVLTIKRTGNNNSTSRPNFTNTFTPDAKQASQSRFDRNHFDNQSPSFPTVPDPVFQNSAPPAYTNSPDAGHSTQVAPQQLFSQSASLPGSIAKLVMEDQREEEGDKEFSLGADEELSNPIGLGDPCGSCPNALDSFECRTTISSSNSFKKQEALPPLPKARRSTDQSMVGLSEKSNQAATAAMNELIQSAKKVKKTYTYTIHELMKIGERKMCFQALTVTHPTMKMIKERTIESKTPGTHAVTNTRTEQRTTIAKERRQNKRDEEPKKEEKRNKKNFNDEPDLPPGGVSRNVRDQKNKNEKHSRREPGRIDRDEREATGNPADDTFEGDPLWDMPISKDVPQLDELASRAKDFERQIRKEVGEKGGLQPFNFRDDLEPFDFSIGKDDKDTSLENTATKNVSSELESGMPLWADDDEDEMMFSSNQPSGRPAGFMSSAAAGSHPPPPAITTTSSQDKGQALLSFIKKSTGSSSAAITPSSNFNVQLQNSANNPSFHHPPPPPPPPPPVSAPLVSAPLVSAAPANSTTNQSALLRHKLSMGANAKTPSTPPVNVQQHQFALSHAAPMTRSHPTVVPMEAQSAPPAFGNLQMQQHMIFLQQQQAMAKMPHSAVASNPAAAAGMIHSAFPATTGIPPNNMNRVPQNSALYQQQQQQQQQLRMNPAAVPANMMQYQQQQLNKPGLAPPAAATTPRQGFLGKVPPPPPPSTNVVASPMNVPPAAAMMTQQHQQQMQRQQQQMQFVQRPGDYPKMPGQEQRTQEQQRQQSLLQQESLLMQRIQEQQQHQQMHHIHQQQMQQQYQMQMLQQINQRQMQAGKAVPPPPPPPPQI
eukprot:GDKJ01057957.1.p1 GENE.GDKJ01057957.1~~GDKJ01057957.1.p1  ORF type:complete len:859 (+),score=300.10 GDKJ01057957.1:1-2577(+)